MTAVSAPQPAAGATPLHQLRGRLKALKLGGMLATLEQRLGQAQQGRLGYLDFLELLLEDEVQRRAQHGLARRLAAARFEALPFRAMHGFPAEIAAGSLAAGQVAAGYGWQVLWTALLIAVAVLTWRAGVRRYEAVGG